MASRNLPFMATEPTKTKQPIIECNLFTRHAIEVAARKMPGFGERLIWLAEETSRHGYYPDGTLLIEGENTTGMLLNFLARNRLLGSGDEDGVWQPNGYGSLDPFPSKVCYLWYTAAYRESLGDFDFSILFPAICSRPTSDYQLENLQISVGFSRRPSVQVRRRFAAYLGEWFGSVSERGVFGEGPVMPVSWEVEFRGRWAQFWIDASKSGQDTLNWLLIWVLNFGYTVSRVADFAFDHKIELFLCETLDDRAEKILIPR